VSGQYPSWLVALAAAGALVSLGMRTRLLARPELRIRCPACGKLVWHKRLCSCAK
jgi:hypothetical protein